MCELLDLLVVPTSGNIRDSAGKLRTGKHCAIRIDAAAIQMRTNEGLYLVLAGGARASQQLSEASLAFTYVQENYPDLVDRVVLVSAKSKYTAGDMVALAADLKELSSKHGYRLKWLRIVSHPDHAILAAKTLIWLGWRNIGILDSGEPAPYSRVKLAALKLVYELDPTWEKLWTLPLRWRLNRRGRDE